MSLNRTGIIAGISFSEFHLRYSLVDHDAGLAIQSLGSCEFDFNVVESIRTGPSENAIKTIAEAFAEVIVNSNATLVAAAVTPAFGRTYYTLVDDSLPSDQRKEQFSREAQLLTSQGQSFFPAASSLHSVVEAGSTKTHEWNLVTLVPTDIKKALDKIVEPTGLPSTLLSSVEAASKTVANREISREESSGFSLLIGQHVHKVEIAILHDGRIVHGHTVSVSSGEDYLYWIAVLTTRLEVSPSLIDTVYLYGDDIKTEYVERIIKTLHAEAFVIDPIQFAPFQVTKVRPDFDSGAYTLCLGAAL